MISIIKNKIEISDSFNFVWDNCIFPAIKVCEKKITIANIGSNFSNIDIFKKRLFETYHKEREEFKKSWHSKHGEGKLSFSKLAAVVCSALIRNKFFKISVDQKTLDSVHNLKKELIIDNYLINYKLAFYAGLGVVYASLISDVSNDTEKCNIILGEKHLYFPQEKTEDNDTCQDHIIKNLAKKDLKNIDTDLVELAVIYRMYKELSIAKFLG